MIDYSKFITIIFSMLVIVLLFVSLFISWSIAAVFSPRGFSVIDVAKMAAIHGVMALLVGLIVADQMLQFVILFPVIVFLLHTFWELDMGEMIKVMIIQSVIHGIIIFTFFSMMA